MNDTLSLAEAPRWKWSYAWLVVALSFLSYVFVLFKGQWIWDDPDYIWRNPNLVEEEGLKNIWADNSATPQYYPIVHTSFWIEYQLIDPDTHYSEDLDATLFHFNNVLIFALTGLAFWKVLLRLRVRGALIAVLLFAAHPVNVESVAWVTERKNMLSGLFALLTILCFFRFLRIGDEGDDGAPKAERTHEALRWDWLATGFGFWVLGLLSKSVIAFVPPALFLIVWWKRPKDLFRADVLGPLLLLLIPGAIAGLHTAWLEREQVGARDVFFPEYDHFGDRLMLAGTVVWVYLKHVVLPLEQMFFYPKWDPEVSSWWQWVLLITAVALPITLLAKSKEWGRGPLVAVLIFGGALFPVMGFTNVYPMRFSWVADHFQYHANFAMFGLIGALLTRLPIPQAPGRVAFGILLAGGVGLSNLHGLAYENSEALWRRTIASNPDCWIAYENLGVQVNNQAIQAREEGDEQRARELEQEAMNLFYKALEFERDPHLLQSIANNHLGWYSRYRNLNDLERAEATLIEALESWPDLGSLHKLMGDVHLAHRRYDDAYASFDRALTYLREQKFQQEFLEKKMLGSVGSRIAINWSVAAFGYGRDLLSEGKGAEALEIFSGPREPYGLPNLTPIAELYTWGPPSKWFEVEQHRLWMLAAYHDPQVRNPQAAFEGVQRLMRQAGVRLQAGGVPQDVQMRMQIEVIDLQAAIYASLGRFPEAIQASAEAVRQARENRAPATYIEQLAQRNQVYRDKTAYRFRLRVPAFGS
ncbi:MAG: hypothetical protein MK209_02865 [Planctomycetes bacterium]|nr:hypothetical protein [Planctomycetota bacterium]